MSVSHYIPSELKQSSFSVNSVVKSRQTNTFIPINGSNGYSKQKKEIEFQVSHKDLFDLTTLQMSFDLSGKTADGSNCVFKDLASSVINTVDVYIADKLVERVEKFNELTQAMVLASVNDSYYEHELNMMEGAYEYSKNEDNKARQGQFMINFGILGISKIQQYLPLYHNNLRIVIRLEDPDVCSNGDNNNSYQLNDVLLMCDTVEPIESYKTKLEAIIRSEQGLAVPIQSYDVKTRTYQSTMNFNLSYAELDSIFGFVNSPGKSIIEAPSAQYIDGLTVNMNGKYLTPTQGLHGHAQIYNSMRKSLALPHDVGGSTMLNYKNWTEEFTLYGVDCERVPSPHHVFSSGINTREFGYSLDWLFSETTAVPPNSKFVLACLHRKMVKMSQNAVSVME